MIEADPTAFPGNVVERVVPRVASLDADLFVVPRPLQPTDPQQSVGVFPAQWDPQEMTQEMGKLFPGEPTLQRYHFVLQALIKHTDQAEGTAVISALSSMIRRMLYRDAALNVALSSLSTSALGSIERAQRWGVGGQRFLTNEISGNWIFVSTLEFWVETEST